jgi:hypothetical protein
MSCTTRALIRAIGVSNFYPDRLVDLIDHKEISCAYLSAAMRWLPPDRCRPPASYLTDAG